MRYEKPVITDFGSIGDHTFQTPGAGTKSATPMFCDKFSEFSHTDPEEGHHPDADC